MKWLKSRTKFLSEAKIGEIITPKQAEVVKQLWGEKYLDFEQINPTTKIKTGRWKLSEEDKRKVLGTFLTANIDTVYSVFENLPEQFVTAINESVDLTLLKSDDKWEKILNRFDISKPTINQISVLTDPIFRKISVSETMASEVILRGEDGRPILDEETKRPKKVPKEPGQIIYSKNLVNINSFVEDFNRCFPEQKINAEVFTTGDISRLVSKSREDFSGEGYQVEVDIYGRDMFLVIEHNPVDILNMSISRFYSSCQNLYSGGYRERVLGNVFDPNSIPAFLLFDSSIHNEHGEHISDTLPVSRMMIRNIETFKEEKEPKIFFDRAYPDRMKTLFGEIVEKYSSNIQTVTEFNIDYVFSPDLPEKEAGDIRDPYMDRLGTKRARYIGVNAGKIEFAINSDWSKTIISDKAKVQELTIATTNLPQNFFDLQLNPNWIKFKFLKLNSADAFSNIKTNSLAFEKCQLNSDVLQQFCKAFGEIKKLQFVNCNLDSVDFNNLGDLDELHLIFTLKSNQLESKLQNLNFKKLVISTDVANANKKFINSLKAKGKKIETVGPNI
jgi:hypothetical protein